MKCIYFLNIVHKMNYNQFMVHSIALIGASGTIGHVLSQQLAQENTPYRVIGRSKSSLAQTFGNDPLAEVAEWNPDQPETIESALAGVETAVYMVGVPYWEFDKHPKIIRATLAAAEKAGVRRMLLIGTVYPYGRPQQNPVREDHPRNPHTFKGRMRKEQEDLLLDAHAAGKIQGAVLRLPDFYGPGVKNSLLDGLIQAAAKGGRANMIGPIDRPHEFVYIPDVAPVVTRLLKTDGAFGRVWHLAGSGTTTQQDMLTQLEQLVGHKIPKMVLGLTGLRLIGLFNPMLREMVEMHYLQTEPVILDDSALQGLIGPIAKTLYAEGLTKSLEHARHITA